jgi:hypothetical protein
MKVLRKHFFLRFFWFGVALHLLNCAIDAPDPSPDHLAENLNVNDLESLTEVLLEQVLGIDNALAEYDEHDPGEAGSAEEAPATNLFYQPLPRPGFTKPTAPSGKLAYPTQVDGLTSTWPDVPAPPPWA